MACAPAQIPHRFDRDFCIGQRVSHRLMLDDWRNASAPFYPGEVQCKVECRPHECHAENSDQCCRAGKTGGRQSKAVTFLTEQIRSWRRDIFETKQRGEVRTVAYGLNCAFESSKSRVQTAIRLSLMCSPRASGSSKELMYVTL